MSLCDESPPRQGAQSAQRALCFAGSARCRTQLPAQTPAGAAWSLPGTHSTGSSESIRLPFCTVHQMLHPFSPCREAWISHDVAVSQGSEKPYPPLATQVTLLSYTCCLCNAQHGSLSAEEQNPSVAPPQTQRCGSAQAEPGQGASSAGAPGRSSAGRVAPFPEQRKWTVKRSESCGLLPYLLSGRLRYEGPV